MTANQWYVAITKVLDPTDPTGTQRAIAEIVRRIQLAESERAAGVADEHDPVETGRSIADEIIRTSPGKGGG